MLASGQKMRTAQRGADDGQGLGLGDGTGLGLGDGSGLELGDGSGLGLGDGEGLCGVEKTSYVSCAAVKGYEVGRSGVPDSSSHSSA